MNKEAIIIFLKNPVAGKVKTRLAKSIGDEAALKVYLNLLKHTDETVSGLSSDKRLYYSDHIPDKNIFFHENNGAFLQQGRELGERMAAAFLETFREGYEKVVIIGSDCMQLKKENIQSAFNALDRKDVVIGPAEDGGYYLLGLKKLYPDLFLNKTWSSPFVLTETIQSVKNLGLQWALLPKLADVDEYSDLIKQKISH